MTLPSVAITVPTWRRGLLFKKCVESLLKQDYQGHVEVMCVVDYDELEAVDEKDRWTEPVPDIERALELQRLAALGGFAGLRSVRIKRGPGRSNWRPGAIHFPVFEHWLQTKCDLVSYQFSDEWSGPTRIRRQVAEMLSTKLLWCYCQYVHIESPDINKRCSRNYYFHRNLVPTNQLMTPTIIVDRQAFEQVGGLDYPVHAAAKAEEWIQTHCALLGQPASIAGADTYYFLEHLESLGGSQRPGSESYKTNIAETGFIEEDHWRLWNRVLPIYDERVAKAKKIR